MPTLDTSFLIDLIRQKPEAIVKINVLIEAGIPLATTTINILELYKRGIPVCIVTRQYAGGPGYTKRAH